MNSFHFLTKYLIILGLAFVSLPASAQVSFSISLDVAPPPLVVEDQPACPDDGLIWTPGYWAYDDGQGAYYWVPGAWVQPPEVGLYWTPAYWAWNGNAYTFNEGYWGPTVGFYGGVNYGHGYWGHGYGGGRWDNGHFAYNTAANNVKGGHVHNTYADRSGVVKGGSHRVSYNGGHGGVQVQPSPQEQQVAQNRVQPTPQQQTHFQQAAQQRSHQVKVNAHPASANAPAANQAQAPQQHTASEPPVNKQEAAFTGGDAQAQKQNPAEHKQGAPMKPEAAAVNNPVKPEEKPHVKEQPAQIKTEAAPSQPKPEEKPHVEGPQGSNASSISHDKPAEAQHQDKPQGQPQAQHQDKPQGQSQAKPEAKSDDKNQQGNQPGGGH